MKILVQRMFCLLQIRKKTAPLPEGQFVLAADALQD